MADKIGPTGDWPRGKLNKDDEGGLAIAICTEKDVVKIMFGKNVSWIGLPKEMALAFAKLIVERAEKLP